MFLNGEHDGFGGLNSAYTSALLSSLENPYIAPSPPVTFDGSAAISMPNQSSYGGDSGSGLGDLIGPLFQALGSDSGGGMFGGGSEAAGAAGAEGAAGAAGSSAGAGAAASAPTTFGATTSGAGATTAGTAGTTTATAGSSMAGPAAAIPVAIHMGTMYANDPEKAYGSSEQRSPTAMKDSFSGGVFGEDQGENVYNGKTSLPQYGMSQMGKNAREQGRFGPSSNLAYMKLLGANGSGSGGSFLSGLGGGGSFG